MKNLYKCNLEDHLHRRKKTKSKNSITSSLNYYEWSNNYSTRCKRCLHLYKNDNWHFQNIYAIWRIIFIEEKRPSPKTLYVTSSLNHHERSNNYSTRCKRCLHLYKNGGKTFTNATWRIISIEEKESSPKTLYVTSSLNHHERSNNYSTWCKRCLHLYKNDNWHFQNVYATWRIISIEEKESSPKTL